MRDLERERQEQERMVSAAEQYLRQAKQLPAETKEEAQHRRAEIGYWSRAVADLREQVGA